MPKVKYAVNESGKIQIITKGGKKIRVYPHDRVPIEEVMSRDAAGNPVLPEGFVPQGDLAVPALSTEEKVDEVLADKAPAVPAAPVGPLVTSPAAPPKSAKPAKPKAPYTIEEVEGMKYNELRAAAKELNLATGNRKKADLLAAVKRKLRRM